MQSEEVTSLNFLFFSSSDLEAQCLGLHLPFFCRKENLQSMIKLRFGVSGVEIW